MPAGKKKSKKKSPKSKGLSALRHYRRFLKAEMRAGKSPTQAKKAWKRAQKIKLQTLNRCLRTAKKQAYGQMKRAGIAPAAAKVVETTGGEFTRLGSKSEAQQRAVWNYASLIPGTEAWAHRKAREGRSAAAASEAELQAKYGGDPRKRRSKRRLKKKTGKKTKKFRTKWAVRGQKARRAYYAVRMRRSMKAIGASWKDPKHKPIMVALDRRRRARKGGHRHGHRVHHKSATHFRSFRAFRKANKGSGKTKKQLRVEWRKAHDWPETPNWHTTRGKKPAKSHHRVTQKNWGTPGHPGARRREYGKKGFSRKGLAALARAGKKSHRKGRRKGR